MVNAYLQALGAHINYWYENDVSLFILSKLLDLSPASLAAAATAAAATPPPLPARTPSMSVSSGSLNTAVAQPAHPPPSYTPTDAASDAMSM